MATFTLKKHEKLKSKKLTDLLFKEGTAFYSFPFRVVYLFAKPEFKIPAGRDFREGYPIQFGISVSSKNFKNATDRNLLKRRGREAWRLHKADCYKVANQMQKEMAVFFIYTPKTILPYKEIEAGVIKGIKRVNVILENKNINPEKE